MENILLAIGSFAIMVFMFSLCDRIRGGWEPTKHVRLPVNFLYGYLIAFAFGYGAHWIALACAVLWWIGEKPGTGWPQARALIGVKRHATLFPDRKPERHEKLLGIENIDPFAALFIRGFIWGLPVLPLAYFDLIFAVVPLAMAFSMPAAIKIQNKLFPWPKYPSWGPAEWIRGALFGAVIVFTGAFA